MNQAEAFRIAIKPFGQPLSADSVHPDTAQGFDEFRDFFRNVLSNNKELAASQVYCDWVDNTNLNAFATTHGDHEIIAMFAGAAVYIYNYFYCYLSDPSSLPLIGNPSCETPDAAAIEALRKKEFLPLPRLPADPIRKRAAMHLAWNAVMFLFLHEVGHIVLCHLRLLSEMFGSSDYLELPADSSSSELTHLRVLLEIDADQSAAANSLRLWRSMWRNNAFPALTNMTVEACWSISISMTFRIMDSFQNPKHRPGYTTHPPPMVRLLHIANLNAEPSQSQYIGPEEVMVSGFNGISRWWKLNNLPMSGGDHGVTTGTIDELNALRRELAETYGDRLKAYKDERRRTRGTIDADDIDASESYNIDTK